MIESFSEAVAKKLKQMNPDETSSVEVMKYGLAMSLNLLLSVGCALLIGAFTDRLGETIEAVVAFALIRRFSGGVHAPNLTACFLVSVLIFVTIPHFEIGIGSWGWWGASICTISLVLGLAHTDYSGRKKYLHKTISVLIIAIGMTYESSSVTLAMFVQAILLIKRR